MAVKRPCPKCGAELDVDEVDIGVGTQVHVIGCPQCQWVPEPPLAEKLAEDLPEVHVPEAMPERLSPALAFDMGRRSIHLERSEGVEQHLAEQRQVYLETLRSNPGLLIQALIDRDRVIAQMGRMMADGRAGTGLLREFVRGAMYLADRGSPEAVQKYLEETFGPGMKADARQLRMHGHTLGPTLDQRLDPAQAAIDTASTAPKGTVEE